MKYPDTFFTNRRESILDIKKGADLINSATPDDPDTPNQQIDGLCSQLAKLRGNTLLVMYYPDDRGQIRYDDMERDYKLV